MKTIILLFITAIAALCTCAQTWSITNNLPQCDDVWRDTHSGVNIKVYGTGWNMRTQEPYDVAYRWPTGVEDSDYTTNFVKRFTWVSSRTWTNYVTTLSNPPPLTVQWQYDDIRAKLKKYEEQKARAAEFNKTNTIFFMANDALTFQCNVTTNDIETGYRSDGVVVWRHFPENIHVGGF